jgi:hypothetical protein
MPKGTPGRPACTIDGCERPHYGRGWCNMHYTRWRTHGDPLMLSQGPGHLERLRTHCPADHPYDVENTYVYRGRRHCRACRRAANVAYRARKRAS